MRVDRLVSLAGPHDALVVADGATVTAFGSLVTVTGLEGSLTFDLADPIYLLHPPAAHFARQLRALLPR